MFDKRPAQLALTFLLTISPLLLLATGCMTYPEQGTMLAHPSAEFDASGFLTTPGTRVHVECFDVETGQWKVIGDAISGHTPFDWSDTDWYYWSARDLQIPWECWDSPVNQPTQYFARFRARLATGEKLATFDGLIGCWDVDKTALELWEECGHGDEVTLRSRLLN